MAAPRTGAVQPCTVVIISRCGLGTQQRVHGWVSGPSTNYQRWTPHDNTQPVQLFSTNEGVDWIWGHHAPESGEAQALLATHALMRP